MSRESKATKEEIQRNRDEAYLNGWNDGYAEGYGKATADAPTFTAADLERAWRIGRNMSVEACADYPRSSPEYQEYIHYDDQIVYSQDCIRALTPPADLAQRVKE